MTNIAPHEASQATVLPTTSEGVLSALDLQRVHLVQHRSGLCPSKRNLLERCLDRLLESHA